MPRSFTLLQLRTRARERADMVGSRFITDSELNGYVSSSYAELYGKLVKSGLGYAGETVQVITSTGAASYPLAADHFATMGIDYVLNAQTIDALKEIQFQEHVAFLTSGGARAFAFRLVGSNIVLYPTPPTGQVYNHTYVPAPADLSAAVDSTPVDGVAGWEEFIVWDCAAKMLLKEESDATAHLAERDRISARIDEEAEMRSLVGHRHVVEGRSSMTELDAADRWPWQPYPWGND